MTEQAARVSRNAKPVFRAGPAQTGTDTAVKLNGEPERWVLAARLSRVSKKDRMRGDAALDGIQTQDQRGADWAASEGNVIVHVTKDRNISGAVAPWKRPELGPWLTDPTKLIQYDGIVAYEISRLSREYYDTDWLRKWAEANHKKLYVIKDRLRWPDDRDGILWAVAAERAYQERLDIIERVTRELTILKNAGKLTGRPSFGYTSEGPKYDRRLVPTAQGREWVPKIFGWVIDGWSLEAISKYLRDQGVLPESGDWWPRSIGNMIRNPVYMGHRCELTAVPPDDVELDEDNGNPIRYLYGDRWVQKLRWVYGKTIHKCEPLVKSAAVWKKANEALSNQIKRGHSDPDKRAMLSGALYCPVCDDSPMYKTTPSAKAQARCRYITTYYRCAGRGSKRQSCGLMVPVEPVNALVDRIIAGSFDCEIMEDRIIYGNEADIEAEAKRIEFELQQLGAKGLPWDEEDAERARLRAEFDRVAHTERIPDEVKSVPTGEKYYAQWRGLSDAERGAWLVKHGFRVTASKEEVTVAQGSESVTLLLELPPAHARTRLLKLGQCQCGCGTELVGVNANKKYVNGAHAAKAQRQRAKAAAQSA